VTAVPFLLSDTSTHPVQRELRIPDFLLFRTEVNFANAVNQIGQIGKLLTCLESVFSVYLCHSCMLKSTVNYL